jgi:transcriptional regulator of met regulon
VELVKKQKAGSLFKRKQELAASFTRRGFLNATAATGAAIVCERSLHAAFLDPPANQRILAIDMHNHADLHMAQSDQAPDDGALSKANAAVRLLRN